jgi:pyruvate/2-oxoglutarate dehydrogenase complex dihydrolipoamide dehydrogenase (E3) component
MTDVVIIGGGPGGYEAALVAAQLGASVFMVDRDGLGGAAVLTDVVPSKTAIEAANILTRAVEGARFGLQFGGKMTSYSRVGVEIVTLNAHIRDLAEAQSADIAEGVRKAGVAVIQGEGYLRSATEVCVRDSDVVLHADVVLLCTGARPRELDSAKPDGERILTWKQLYDLQVLPEHLIVVGSGVTGAEFMSAYHGLGSKVTLVSSREHVLPGQDVEAAKVIEDVSARRGITVISKSRADSVIRDGDHVVVTLSDGRTIEGSHCLMAVGSLPNTEMLGLDAAGVSISASGHIVVDRVSRTSIRGIYAAGDCTGVLMLASVAAMQGRIAMRHALGGAVTPLDTRVVTANIFTDPEIATVGVTQEQIDAGAVLADVVMLPLATNARAKMQNIREGFVKLFCDRGSRVVLGGVVVSPRASELIYSVALAVTQRLTVDDLAATFTVYPSLTGSIAEAARQLHLPD